MGKKSGSGSGMNNSNHISKSLESIFSGIKILTFFDADPRSGLKKIGSGIRDGKIRIRDKRPGYATLQKSWNLTRWIQVTRVQIISGHVF
jgi:hypothetical protein